MLDDTNPTAGVTAGDTGDGGQTQPVGQDDGGPQPQPERTFTQDDVDRIVRERLAREQRKYEQQIEELRQQQYTEPNQDDYALGDEALDPYERRFLTLEEQLEDMRIESEISTLRQKYKDFAEHEDEIIRLALDRGIPDLEVAYGYWKYGKMDVDNLKKQAIQEYLNSKRQQVQTSPKPEGGGGAAPSGARKINSFDDAKKAALERLKHQEE